MSRLLLAIVLLGLAARVAYVVRYPQEPVALDAEGYDNAAEGLLNSGELVDSRHGPLYPSFLAATYKVFGHSYTAARVAQAVLVSLTALVAFALARVIFGPDRGLLGAWLVSFYPGFMFYSGVLLTETLFALLLTLFALCLVMAQRRRGFAWPVASGLALGLATLCRTEIVVVALPAAAWLAWQQGGARGVTRAMVLLAACGLTVAPWALREQTDAGRAAPADGGAAATIWLSTYPGDWPEWYEDREPLRSLLACDCNSRELQARFMRAAIQNLKDSPGQYLKMSVKRFGRFWVGSHSIVVRGLETGFQSAPGTSDVLVMSLKAILLILNMTLIALGVAGMYLERASWQAWFPLILIIGSINAVHVVLFSTSRYQIPIMPLVLVMAAPVVHRFIAGRTGPHARKVS